MKNKGFGLVGILIVVGIIALAGGYYYNQNSSLINGEVEEAVTEEREEAVAKSRDVKRISDLKQVQLALEMYLNSNGTYPVATSYKTLVAKDFLNRDYLYSMPNDEEKSFTYLSLSGETYCLGATMELNVPGNDARCDTGSVANDKVYSIQR